VDREPIDWNSRSSRRVEQPATISLGDGGEARAIVTKLSDDGCQIIAETKLTVGETLVVKLPDRDPIHARVRWTAGDRAGINFLSDS
jgi:shikimate 5-dehydrogenase